MSPISRILPAATRGKSSTDSPPASLTEAIRRVIFRRGYVQDLANRLGIEDAKALYRYATDPNNPSEEHRPLPAHMIEPLTATTGQLDILEYLAARAGCILVRRPTPATGTGDLLTMVATITAEFADVQRAVAPALDGVTIEEARTIEQQFNELEAAIESARCAVLAALPRRDLAKAAAR